MKKQINIFEMIDDLEKNITKRLSEVKDKIQREKISLINSAENFEIDDISTKK